MQTIVPHTAVISSNGAGISRLINAAVVSQEFRNLLLADPSKAIEKLGWKPLCTRRKDTFCLAIFKCISGLVPEVLQNYFIIIKNRHGHLTRGSAQGNIAFSFKPKTEAGRRSFLFRGAKAWNAIPANIKCPLPISTSSFKNKYYLVN